MSPARWLSACALLVVTLLPSPVSAQERAGFATEWPWVLSAEHLGGVVFTREAEEDGSVTGTGSVGAFIGPVLEQSPIARLGLHYFLAPPLSVGAIVTYNKNDRTGETTLLGARIGFTLPLAASSHFWLRGGANYFRFQRSSTKATDVRPGGEALFVFTPLDHFGFLLGGMFEIGVAGKVETPTANTKFEHMEYGLTFGVFSNL